MPTTIDLEGYTIESGGTFFGTPGDDSASWGFITSPVVIYLLGGNDVVGGGVGIGEFDDKNTLTIFGGDGNDLIQGNGSLVNFHGGKGKDALHGDGNNDVLYGDLGNDILLGNDRNDTLLGGKGDDELNGGRGDDFIVGGRGKNVAYGDGFVVGGDGKDIFVIENFGQPGNYTEIRDFVDGEDKIGLGNGLSFQALSITDTGFDLVMRLRNSSEPLAILTKLVSGQESLTVSSFTQDDFLSI